MARKKTKISSARIAWLVAALLAIIACAWAWMHRRQLHSAASMVATELPLPPATSAPPAPAESHVQVTGKLQIRVPARDAQLGVTADAVALLRSVAMYQWQERCDEHGCRYDKSWSERPVDSQKFREPRGHLNPPMPFADARFDAGDVRLQDMSVEPELAAFGRAAQDYPLQERALPPKFAATFSVVDGALYAGGDAAHPQVGTLRIRYRVVPAGEVSLAGVRRGSKLQAR